MHTSPAQNIYHKRLIQETELIARYTASGFADQLIKSNEEILQQTYFERKKIGRVLRNRK